MRLSVCPGESERQPPKAGDCLHEWFGKGAGRSGAYQSCKGRAKRTVISRERPAPRHLDRRTRFLDSVVRQRPVIVRLSVCPGESERQPPKAGDCLHEWFGKGAGRSGAYQSCKGRAKRTVISRERRAPRHLDRRDAISRPHRAPKARNLVRLPACPGESERQRPKAGDCLHERSEKGVRRSLAVLQRARQKGCNLSRAPCAAPSRSTHAISRLRCAPKARNLVRLPACPGGERKAAA